MTAPRTTTGHGPIPGVTITDQTAFEAACDVLIIGAGAAGLVAALRAHEAGASVAILERDRLAQGSTALSAGLIPAAGTSVQARAGIADSPAQFARDIMAKAHDEPDAATATTLTTAIAEAIDWLASAKGLPFSLITNFTYPGHSACRMHGLPSRSGAELMDRLRSAVEDAEIPLLLEARATTLLVDRTQRIVGVQFARPDGSIESIGCGALILACNGYGGNRELVRRHIPDAGEALYFGHPGNCGEALIWGEALNASVRHLSGYQGHGSVAHPQGILLTWATMTEGGFQINLDGERFSNEAAGYSEQAAHVLAQRKGIAWSIFDARIAGIARQFEDFRTLERMGALGTADTVAGLATLTGVPAAALAETFAGIAQARSGTADRFGRDFRDTPPLAAPFHAVQVTGALFHTQGGLVVDHAARVLSKVDNRPLPNLHAVGGAACGVSGSGASGYLSGNGLLSAVGFGYIAGKAAAQSQCVP